MTDTVIRVEQLGKRYQIRHQAGGGVAGYNTLGETISAGLRGWFGKNGSRRWRSSREEFWALRDVSFQMHSGEVVGIIGRNGAGKSTLLKILTRITEPTTGRAVVAGKVASLLEVGTGFHPELTGRENVFLNGAILGMSRAEIKRVFPAIVDFAEVARFLDTPVKRYSSGMYVRLGFAIAAHLRPRILLVDEVLAVGDASFQRKCLKQIRRVSQEGAAVVMVSHSMTMIENLCQRAIWLEHGQIVSDGGAQRVVAQYIDHINSSDKARRIGEYENLGHRRGTGDVQFTACRLKDCHGRETRQFEMGKPFHVEVDFEAHQDAEAVFGIAVKDRATLTVVTSWVGRCQPVRLRAGQRGTFSAVFPTNPFRARNYFLYLGIVGTGQTDVPYDVWDGGGTEFTVSYPQEVDSLPFNVGRDPALVSVPVRPNVRIA